MRLDDAPDAQQHILLDLVEGDPHRGLGEGVDHDVQRARPERVEVHDQRLRGVDAVVRGQHGADVGDDGLDHAEIVVAHADGLFQAAVRHARGVAYRKFKRPFRAVCWVGGGRASPVLGTDRTSVSGISASRGHAAALSAAMLR